MRCVGPLCVNVTVQLHKHPIVIPHVDSDGGYGEEGMVRRIRGVGVGIALSRL